jgi:hypothetical protein
MSDKVKFLVRFLKEHGCLQAFKINFNKSELESQIRGIRKARALKEYIDDLPFISYEIISAFMWSETPEGTMYWLKLDNILREELGKKEHTYDKKQTPS